MKRLLLLAAFGPLLAACDDSTSPEDAAQVSVLFQATTSAQAAASPGGSASLAAAAATGPITLTGGGHTLVLEDIRLIVSEIELEASEDACAASGGDDCEEFEGGPFLVDLLNENVEEVVTALVPAGAYEEFEFEVEDLDVDDGDDPDDRVVLDLLAEMRQAYPAFPEEASMVVSGTYDGRPFTVFFEAEIEVEREFATPFLVPGDGAIVVGLDPAAWFVEGGVPMDLSAFDGRLLEFELEFEQGLEIDHD